MRRSSLANKAMYAGAGSGMIWYMVEGLLPGSFLGGIAGLHIAGGIFGFPLTPALLPRIIVGSSMLCGAILAGMIFILSGAMLGLLCGKAGDHAGKLYRCRAFLKRD